MFEKQINLANAIYTYRKINNLSLREASNLLKVSHTFLGKIEKGTGNANPTELTIYTISRNSNLPYYQLMMSSDHSFGDIKGMSTEDLNWDISKLQHALSSNYNIEATTEFKRIYTYKEQVLQSLGDKNPLKSLSMNEDRMMEIALIQTDVTLDEAIEISLAFYTPFSTLFRIKKPSYDLNQNNDDDANVAYQVHKHIEKVRIPYLKLRDENTTTLENRLDKLRERIGTLAEIEYLDECLSLYRKHLASS
jgi:transcriptional regulator with XRE-family HTH domain